MINLNYLDIERQARRLQSEEVRRLLVLALSEFRRVLRRKYTVVFPVARPAP